MDAELLSPRRMMADVSGGSSKLASAELEVLKLQELVRRLERQNEQLRSRAGAGSDGSAGPRPCLALQSPGAAALRSLEEPLAYFQPSSASPDAAAEERDPAGAAGALDELDVLDLDSVLPAGEPDSWLYESPKAKQTDGSLSALQWCRQVLEHPGPEVELAKITFCHRLDQARRWRAVTSVRPYSCIEGLSTLSCPVLPYTKAAALFEPPAPLSAPPKTAVLPTPPLRAGCSLDRAPSFLSNSLHSRRQAAITPQSSLDSDAGVSELEDDSISMSYKLQDMTDVEVMARLQEESLRQDYASTSATASRRTSSLSLHSIRRCHMDLEEEDEEDEGYDQLPPPQPRLLRTGSLQRAGLPHSHTFSSIRDCRRGSPGPQFSLGGLSQLSGPSSLISDTHTGFRVNADKLRKSMPNLIRAPSMPSVPSMSCLASPANTLANGPSSLPLVSSMRSSQSFDSSSGLARLQSSIPPPGQLTQRVQSVGNFPTNLRHPLKATAYVSPTVLQGPPPSSLSTSTSLSSIQSSAVPPQPLKPTGSSLQPPALKPCANQPAVPRSSLPRPASFVATGAPRTSKISQPTRSLLTPPKSLSALSALRDGSWRDGCY